MEKAFEGGEGIQEMLDDMIAQCRANNMLMPYVIVLVPANGGVSIARATEKKGEALFRMSPVGEIAASPITVILVDANGRIAHFELSETGKLTLH